MHLARSQNLIKFQRSAAFEQQGCIRVLFFHSKESLFHHFSGHQLPKQACFSLVIGFPFCVNQHSFHLRYRQLLMTYEKRPVHV